MQAEYFLSSLHKRGIDFFTGVPDSLLNALCTELSASELTHIVAPNEGAAVALAAGHTIATGKFSCVYCQNSGLGNLMNPVCSMTHEQVYGIPMLLVVGWRGEPGVKDEPQHLFQGRVTLETLQLLEIEPTVITPETTEPAFEDILNCAIRRLEMGFSAAIVVKKGTLESGKRLPSNNAYILARERAIEIIVENIRNCTVVSSTGKISRELYETRDRMEVGHQNDFLTVGSMGHCSSIALAIALAHPQKQVVCLDGDGAVLMHMGALATIGAQSPHNLLHIVLDNEAHETVGGVPTASKTTDFCAIAAACGYRDTYEVCSEEGLRETLARMGERTCGPTFLRVKVALGARMNLGRPALSPRENLRQFKNELRR